MARSGLSYLRGDQFLILLLGATLFSRVLWAVAIPAWQSPDEIQHFGYVQSMGENLSLSPSDHISQEIGTAEGITGLGAVPAHPDETQFFAPNSLKGPNEDELGRIPAAQRSTDDEVRNNSAKQYPPTYYLIASAVYRLLTSFNVLTILFGVRVLSAALSTITMLFGYLTLKRYFEQSLAAKSCAMVISMSPMYAYMGAMVNPEVLICLLFSVLIYLMTRALDDGLSPAMNIGLGATMVVGALVKQTFLIAVPLYFILLGFLLARKQLAPRRAAFSAGAVLAMLMATAGWLYLSGIISTETAYPGGVREPRSVTGFLSHLNDDWPLYAFTFDEFWGSFGWLDTPISLQAFSLIRTGCAIASVGLVFHLAASASARKPDVKTLFFVLIAVTYVAAWVGLNYLRITSGEFWLLQGRYFFPIIVPIIAVLLRGLLWFVPHARARDWVLIALVAGVMLFQVDALVGYVLPRYYA